MWDDKAGSVRAEARGGPLDLDCARRPTRIVPHDLSADYPAGTGSVPSSEQLAVLGAVQVGVQAERNCGDVERQLQTAHWPTTHTTAMLDQAGTIQIFLAPRAAKWSSEVERPNACGDVERPHALLVSVGSLCAES